jgi:hypothetical protein
MTHENEKASRDWREIVADSHNESDPEKIRKLAEELDRALDRRDKISVKGERGSFFRKKSA